MLDALIHRRRGLSGLAVSAASFSKQGWCLALHGADEYLVAPRDHLVDHRIDEVFPLPLAQVFQYGITYALAHGESYRFEIHLHDGQRLAGFHVEMTATGQGEVVAIFRSVDPIADLAIRVPYLVGCRS